MTKPKPIQSKPDRPRVVIVGDHPWSGYAGEVTGVEQTAVGKMIIVKLDNGESAGVFSRANLKYLG